MSLKKRGLGRNLSELLSLTPESLANVAGMDDYEPQNNNNSLKFIPLEQIQRGKYQPRKDFSQESLQELAQSIKAQGLLQPIVIRSLDFEKYEIIAGERRWRAAQLAGMDKIPALIKNVSDEATMALALIENIQRENLNAVEEAVAIQRLMDDCQLTHQEVADALGKSRTSITNLLRILQLMPTVRKMLENGDIDLGHAKVLLALNGASQEQAAKLICERNLSVRQAEELVKKMLSPVATQAEVKSVDPDVNNLQTSLSEKIGAKVQIDYNSKGKGKVVIYYNSFDELEGVLDHIR